MYIYIFYFYWLTKELPFVVTILKENNLSQFIGRRSCFD